MTADIASVQLHLQFPCLSRVLIIACTFVRYAFSVDRVSGQNKKLDSLKCQLDDLIVQVGGEPQGYSVDWMVLGK